MRWQLQAIPGFQDGVQLAAVVGGASVQSVCIKFEVGCHAQHVQEAEQPCGSRLSRVGDMHPQTLKLCSNCACLTCLFHAQLDKLPSRGLRGAPSGIQSGQT